MNSALAIVGLILFLQVYWLIPNARQNQFLILGAVAVGLSVAPLTLAFAIGLSVMVYWALTKGRHVSPVGIVLVCLVPLIGIKLFNDQLRGVGLLGLSYFTFVLLGAYLDLRRVDADKMLRPSTYFSFALFFPIVPIGPIERVANLGRQLAVPRIWKSENFTTGLLLIALGIFKKVVIADRLSELAVDADRVALAYHGFTMWAFALLSLLQVYADFSSVVDIVRGFSRLLGIDLVDNFDRPYVAESVQDIWKRWHTSLVSWLRDFVYTPIAIRTRSVVIASGAVMLAIGMWHEVSWRFLLWAVYWIGIFWVAVLVRKYGWRVPVPKTLRIVLMVALMALSTLFIMPTSMSELSALAANFVSFTGPGSKPLRISDYNLGVALLGFVGVVLVDSIAPRLGVRFQNRDDWQGSKILALGVSVGLLLLAIALAAGTWEKFIYLRY